jgi:hypothetical protein
MTVVALQGTTTALPNDGMTSQAPRWHDSSSSVGSSKALTVWAQAPPRQWRRCLMTPGLDLSPTVLDLGSGGFFIFEN